MKYYPIKLLFMAGISVLLFSVSNAQTDTVIFNKSYKGLSWAEFVQKAQSETEYRFFFDDDSLKFLDVLTSSEKDGYGLSDLEAFLLSEGYKMWHYKHNVFVSADGHLSLDLPDSFFETEYYRFPDETSDADYLSGEAEYIPLVYTIGEKDKDRKKTATFSGYLINNYDGKPVVGAVMKVKGEDKSSMSGENGFFSLTLPKGSYVLHISGVEIEPANIELHLLSDGQVDIELNRRFVAIDEVMVSSENFHNVRSANLGFDKISAVKTNEIPSSIGENDIVKAGLLLPGVKSAGEGSSGISVRGSPTDQNLFCLDRIPIYNSSHFLGFFSSFNALAISDFTLYKSSIPAEYGGIIGAVGEIKAKESNMRKFSAAGGISPIAANIQAEGPLIKDKLAAMLSFRSGYSEALFDFFDNPTLNSSGATFMDLIGKVTLDINRKNKIKVPVYYSYDNSNLTGERIYDYRTLGVGVEWNRIIAERHNLSTNLAYSAYDFTEENRTQSAFAYEMPFGLRHYEISSKLNIKLNDKHQLTPGVNAVFYQAMPETIVPTDMSSQIQPLEFQDERALLWSVYLNEQWKPFKQLSFQASLRLNSYAYFGPGQRYAYGENGPNSADNIVDTMSYSSGETVARYWHPDYRISANYMITDKLSVKVGLSNMQQYIFMLSNSVTPSPVNKWKLADEHLRPLEGRQYSMGLYANFAELGMEFSAETYYKQVLNYKDYKDGADIIFAPRAEWAVLEGNLDAYGVEFMLKKRTGRLNGWVNYSYSRSIVQTESPFPGEQANFGKSYPSVYDKPHAFNFVGNYRVSRRFSFSVNIVYSTGRPITYPSGVYYLDDSQMLNYSERNAFRVPDYFRTDMSMKFEGNLKAEKKAHGTWVLSAYNVTGRDNVYSVFFSTEDGMIKSYKMSIFAVPIITLSYQFKLGNYADKYF